MAAVLSAGRAEAGLRQDARATSSTSCKRGSARPVTQAPRAASSVEAPEQGSAEEEREQIENLLNQPYEPGFSTEVETAAFAKGLDESTIRGISEKKGEPQWMLDFRLKAYNRWLTMEEPDWSDNRYPAIDFQDMVYYSEPKKKPVKNSLDEVDPEVLQTFERLGISLDEQKRLANVQDGAGSNVAIDAVFDSVSIATTFKEELAKAGVIFCSISEALQEYPDLVRKYFGTVVPPADNYFTGLNSAVFSDGSFVYIPPGVECPMELSTYFRINESETGQFERTLIVADEGSSVSYLEGCTAPAYDEEQLHAAVVELCAEKNAEIKYSTVQNWYAGDSEGNGGIYNFVTKRGLCKGEQSRITWTQVETGSSITWKYPSCILAGDGSVGEFYSVALTNNAMQADTGTKMVHSGKDTKSTIVSKGISAGQSRNAYRGLVKMMPNATNARNHSQCDSMLIGSKSAANTYPYIDVRTDTGKVEHEATTSRISEEQVFYLQQRGISPEQAVKLCVNGFCSDVMHKLPHEFASEVDGLLSLKLEGSVG